MGVLLEEEQALSESLGFDPVEILEHRTWLRRLACALVGADGADDLVQDTFLTALERPPRRTDTPRAWLTRVLRTKATKHHRTRARVHSRERAAARPEVQAESDAAILERAELWSRLASALVQLPEADRVLLLRRYYAGRSAAEIARELDVPASTIRTRIQRALETLRSRLDDDDQGWRPAVIAWLSSPSSGATLTWGVTMKKWITASTALLLLLIGGLTTREWSGLWDSSEEAPRPKATAEDQDEAERSRRDSAPRVMGQSELEPLETPPRALDEAERETISENIAIVRGVIWRTSGKSLQGGRVVLGTRDEVGAAIDEQGYFQMTVDYESDTSVALLWNGTRTQVSKVQTRFDREALIEIEVEDGETIETQVVSAVSGAPLPGTVVWIYNSTAIGQAGYSRVVAGPDGRLAAEFLPPDEYRLFIDHPEHTEREVRGAPSAIPAVIALEPAKPLDVTFVHWPEETFEYVQLHFHTAGIPERSGPIRNVTESVKNVTSESITIRSPGPGLWIVSTMGSGEFPRVSHRVEIDPEAARPAIAVELPPRGTIRLWGTVTDAVNAPVIGARLEIGTSHAITDERGRYEITDGMPAKSARRLLRYGAGNDRVDHPLPPVEITDAPDQRLDLKLAGASSLEVELLGLPEDTIAEIISISMSAADDGQTFAVSYWSEGETTVFEHVPTGRYVLRAEVARIPFDPVVVDTHAGVQRATIEYVEPATIELTVRVPEGVDLPAGVVVGSPIPNESADTPPSFYTFAPIPGGQARVQIPPGERTLTVTGPGFDRWSGLIRVEPGGSTEVELELSPNSVDK